MANNANNPVAPATAPEAKAQKIRIGQMPIRLEGKRLEPGAEIELVAAQVALLPAGSFTVVGE